MCIGCLTRLNGTAYMDGLRCAFRLLGCARIIGAVSCHTELAQGLRALMCGANMQCGLRGSMRTTVAAPHLGFVSGFELSRISTPVRCAAACRVRSRLRVWALCRALYFSTGSRLQVLKRMLCILKPLRLLHW